MRNRRLLLACAFAVAVAGSPVVAAEPVSFDYTKIRGLSPERYETRRDTFRVPMRDGTKLYVEVVRPDTRGRFATILELSPYHGTLADRSGTRILPGPEDDAGAKIGLAGYFAPRGYAVVFADLRGTGKSEGCLDHMGPNDQKDAYDIVEWAAKQPWSNGRVGMTGHSYVGSTPQMAAAQNPPHLVTIVPSAGLAAMYHHEFQYGVPYKLQWVGPLVAYEQLAIERYVNDSRGENLAYAGCGMTQSAGVTGEAYFSGAATQWHKERDFRAGATRTRIPVFAVHGVFDGAARIAALDWFNARRRPGDKAWIGQWGHDPGGNRDDQWTLALHAWFDRHLQRRNVPTGPPVEMFLNGDVVHTPKLWPPTPTRTWRLRALPDGELGTQPAERDAVQFVADPRGSVTGEFDTGRVAFDSAPTRADTLIAGVPSLKLVTSVIGSRVHVNVTLYDVDPDGAVSRMAQATWAIQPELRNGIDKPAVVVPNEVMTIKLPGMAQAHLLPRGHKLRMVVAASHPDKVPTFAKGAAITVVVGDGGTEIALPVVDRPRVVTDVNA